MTDTAYIPEAVLFKKVALPEEFIDVDADGRRVGGDIRMGDLTGDGQVDFLVYKALGGIKPSFLGAFSLAGEKIWEVGQRDFSVADADEDGILTTISPDRPGPVAIYDIDQDGHQEVICFLVDPEVERTSKWNLQGVHLAILDGRTGALKQRAAPEQLVRCNAYVDGEAHIPNYVHQRLMIANFSGNERAQDFVVKLGNDILAFNHRLEVLWHYTNKWYRYPGHSAYIPAVGDLDGDGRDEVNGGHFGLDHDGRVLWETFLGDNVDSVLVEEWGDSKAAILSGSGQVLDAEGEHLLHLGEEVVPHGQEVRYGNLRPDLEGPELAIRYNGHHTDVMIVSSGGVVLNRFQVDESPNNTGMEIVRWNGPGQAELIYSPAALFDAHGKKVVAFPELPPPSGGKMGWYHCFAANVCGDEREEVVLYDPYGDAVYIYSPAPVDEGAFVGYEHTPRQYNARLID
jgi:hypothetical protein